MVPVFFVEKKTADFEAYVPGVIFLQKLRPKMENIANQINMIYIFLGIFPHFVLLGLMETPFCFDREIPQNLKMFFLNFDTK